MQEYNTVSNATTRAESQRKPPAWAYIQKKRHFNELNINWWEFLQPEKHRMWEIGRLRGESPIQKKWYKPEHNSLTRTLRKMMVLVFLCW